MSSQGATRMRWVHTLTALVALGAGGAPAQIYLPHLLADLTPGASTPYARSPSRYLAFGERIAFSFDDGVWLSDGTPGGTSLLVPGAAVPSRVCGDRLIGTRSDPLGTSELWISDGTVEGTSFLPFEVEVVGPSGFGTSTQEDALSNVSCPVAFVARSLDVARRRQLWITDGTGEGTRQIAELDEEMFASRVSWIQSPGAVWAVTVEPTTRLWRASLEGSSIEPVLELVDASIHPPLVVAGRRLLLAAVSYAGAMRFLSAHEELPFVEVVYSGVYELPWNLPSATRPAGDLFYFMAPDVARQNQLWATDGTSSGTRPVTSFTATGGASLVTETAPLGTSNGRAFFLVQEAPELRRLWSTSGSLASSRPVSDGCVGSCTVGSTPFFAVADRALYVRTGDGSRGLWASDGTAAGSLRLTTFAPSYRSSTRAALSHGAAYFQAEDWGETPVRLAILRTDATVAGTALVDERPGGCGYHCYPFSPFDAAEVGFGGLLSIPDTTHGIGPWIVRGGVSPAELLASIGPTQAGYGAFLIPLGAVPGALLFADGGHPSRGLWRSDGTERGTGPFLLGPEGADFAQRAGWEPWLRLGGRLVAVASGSSPLPYGDSRATQIYSTDGTVEGSTRIEIPIEWSRSVANEAKVYLIETYPLNSTRAYPVVWESDGTPEATRVTVDFSSRFRYLADLALLGEDLYFGAERNDGDRGLYRWTPASTEPIRLASIQDSFPALAVDTWRGTVVVQEKFGNSATPDELWLTDGTPAGTTRLTQLGEEFTRLLDSAVLSSAGGNRLVVVESKYASGGDWVRLVAIEGDGSETVLAEPARTSESFYLSPGRIFSAAAGRLFFSWRTATGGIELWVTDGTPGGTHLVRDIAPGILSANPSSLTAVGNGVVFGAWDPAHGTELWFSDGTEAGTSLVADLEPGPRSSNPYGFTLAAGRLFFVAADDAHGRELRVANLTRPAPRRR